MYVSSVVFKFWMDHNRISNIKNYQNNELSSINFFSFFNFIMEDKSLIQEHQFITGERVKNLQKKKKNCVLTRWY